MIDEIKINKYLKDIDRQLEDLQKMPVPNSHLLTKQENFIQTKAIKYTLLVAIEDVIHISAHLVAAMGLGKPKDTSGFIELLGNNNIIPNSFAKEIKRMAGFRNKLVHEYLPNQFDADKLYEILHKLDDFRKFSQYIVKFLESQ